MELPGHTEVHVAVASPSQTDFVLLEGSSLSLNELWVSATAHDPPALAEGGQCPAWVIPAQPMATRWACHWGLSGCGQCLSDGGHLLGVDDDRDEGGMSCWRQLCHLLPRFWASEW